MWSQVGSAAPMRWYMEFQAGVCGYLYSRASELINFSHYFVWPARKARWTSQPSQAFLPGCECNPSATYSRCNSGWYITDIRYNRCNRGYISVASGFPGSTVVKNLPANAAEAGSWVQKIPLSRKWQPIPGFLPGKSHGQRSRVHGVTKSRTQLNRHIVPHTVA